jgi:hypothetical protein
MSQRRVALTVAAWAACLWVGVSVPRDARALTGAGAVAALNAQRAANGIPGDLVERPAWTAACAAHNRYMERNGGLDQSEDRQKPRYTARGAWAARNSALGRDTWTPGRNPWERTPIQLMQLLSPRLTVLGASSSDHHVCATTWPGYLRVPAGEPSLYSYPGDGAVAVPFAQWSFGLPFSPGDFVGLPAGFTTGPHLYVMADAGGEARIVGASLVGPSGAVQIQTVDNTVDGLGGQLPTGGIIIPDSALEPGGTYTASATLAVGGLTLTRRWTFSTELADPHTLLFVTAYASVDASTRPPRITQGSIGVRTISPAPVHMTITSDGQTLASRDLAAGETWTPPQTPGSFQVCAHQEATSYYGGYDGCRPLRIRDLASFSHPTAITIKAALVGRMLRYKLVVRPALGRAVTLSARRRRGNGWHTFRTVVRDANRVLTRSVTARDSDSAVQVQVSVPGIRSGAEVYRAARVVKTIRRR